MASESSPPKKFKAEWEGDGLKKEAESPILDIKTEQDATAFFEKMAEMAEMLKATKNPDISPLDQLFRGYGGTDAADSQLSSGPPDAVAGQDPPASIPTDGFDQFFDFSSFGHIDEDETTSKVATPDLISSGTASTKTSPGSGSEADTTQQSHLSGLIGSSSGSTVKTEDLPSMLRLGPWKELDGGESTYFQPAEFKWDNPMPVLDQSWSIFTS